MAVLAPTAGTAATHGGKAKAAAAQGQAIAVPFPGQAHEHVEPFFDTQVQMGAAAVRINTQDVPAFGYLRNLLLLVTISGAAGGAPALAADTPWNVLADFELTDTNGQQLVGPLTGYQGMLVSKYCGSAWSSDPTLSPLYTAPDANGNAQYLLRVPVEAIPREALGALENENSTATYKFRANVADQATYYTTAPTTKPTVRIQAWVETWTPGEQGGQPPLLGTTVSWSRDQQNVNVGQQTIKQTRLGNSLRMLIFECRDATGVRSDAVFPDPLTCTFDKRELWQMPAKLLKHYMQERYGFTGAKLDTGVYVVDFAHELTGKVGDELRDLWLHTSSATRLELVGAVATAGTVTKITNDVITTGDTFEESI